MGEARYFLKAEFNTVAKAKAALSKVKPLLKDLVKLNQIWQDHRGEAVKTQMARLIKFKSWKVFMPADIKVEDKDTSTNALAGPLPDMTEDFDLKLNGVEVKLNDEVWHFTSWDGIVEWFEKQPGCKSVNQLSDEYVNIEELL